MDASTFSIVSHVSTPKIQLLSRYSQVKDPMHTLHDLVVPVYSQISVNELPHQLVSSSDFTAAVPFSKSVSTSPSPTKYSYEATSSLPSTMSQPNGSGPTAKLPMHSNSLVPNIDYNTMTKTYNSQSLIKFQSHQSFLLSRNLSYSLKYNSINTNSLKYNDKFGINN